MKYPRVVQIYLDSICNLHCFFCYGDRDDVVKHQSFDMTTIDKLSKVISKAKVIPISAWGEPLLSPNLETVLERIYSLNNSNNLIAIVTNGTALSRRTTSLLNGHLADLSISLNASTAETYKRDMGGDFNRTIEAIKEFMVSIHEPHKVSLHMVAHTGNYQEIPGLIDLAASLGISRVRVDQLMVTRKQDLEKSLLNVRDEYNSFVNLAINNAECSGVDFTARLFGKEHGRRQCRIPFTDAYVWVDGRMAPCCYNGNLFMGNINEASFEKIWRGEAYRELRNSPPSTCMSCPFTLPFDDYRVHLSPVFNEKEVMINA